MLVKSLKSIFHSMLWCVNTLSSCLLLFYILVSFPETSCWSLEQLLSSATTHKVQFERLSGTWKDKITLSEVTVASLYCPEATLALHHSGVVLTLPQGLYPSREAKMALLGRANLGIDKNGDFHIEAIAPLNIPITGQGNVAWSGVTGTLSTPVVAIPPHLPDIIEAQWQSGTAQATVYLSGTPFEPELRYVVAVQNLKARLVELNVPIVIADTQILGDSATPLALQTTGTLGTGAFKLHGYYADEAIHLELEGEKLTLANSPSYKITTSGKVKLQASKDGVFIQGDLLVPTAKIAILDKAEMWTQSQDVTIHYDKPAQVANWRYQYLFNVTLGDAVHFEGFGLKSKVIGKIDLSDQTGSVVKGNGRLQLVEGNYQLLGRPFALSHAELLFPSVPLFEPVLDIMAERNIEQHDAPFAPPIRVQMGMKGNAADAKVVLKSIPSLPEEDILSYMLVGYPQNKLNLAQEDVLYQALKEISDTVKPGSANKLDVQRTLKLDDFRIERIPQTDVNTKSHALTVGKRFSESIYLNYSVGLTEVYNRIRVQYLLSRHIKLEASSTTDGIGADIIYHSE